MADRFNELQNNALVSQQPQTPVRKTFGWRPQAQSDELGFLFAIQQFESRRGSWLAIQSEFEAISDEAFTEVLDSFSATAKGVSKFGVGPSGTVDISFEKELSPANFLRGTAEAFDDLGQSSLLGSSIWVVLFF